MSCPAEVIVSETQCNVIEVCTPGPVGPQGPMGNPGPTGPAGGVSQLIAGAGVSISPTDGLGVVTISSTGGTGAVSQIIAGTNVTISPTNGLGNVTINASGGTPLSSITASVATGPVNDYDPAGYVAGTTNRLLLGAASGGSTLTGLLAAPDGWSILVRNTSSTDVITLEHLSGSSTSTNQFSLPGASSFDIVPLQSIWFEYVVNVWTVA